MAWRSFASDLWRPIYQSISCNPVSPTIIWFALETTFRTSGVFQDAFTVDYRMSSLINAMVVYNNVETTTGPLWFLPSKTRWILRVEFAPFSFLGHPQVRMGIYRENNFRLYMIFLSHFCISVKFLSIEASVCSVLSVLSINLDLQRRVRTSVRIGYLISKLSCIWLSTNRLESSGCMCRRLNLTFRLPNMYTFYTASNVPGGSWMVDPFSHVRRLLLTTGCCLQDLSRNFRII